MRIEDRRIERENKGELYQKYIHNDLDACPYCESRRIELIDRYACGGNVLSLQMWCRDCDAEWDDSCKVEYIYETIGPDPDCLEKEK